MVYATLHEPIYRYLDAILLAEPLSSKDLQSLLRFIADQQGKSYCYRTLYGVSEEEWDSPVNTYLGDKLTTKAGKTHILGELASFVLHHSGTVDPQIVQVRDKASNEFLEFTLGYDPTPGRFCCKRCSTALWLHLSQIKTTQAVSFLKAGIAWLESHRDGKGGWQGFHFWDTLFTLSFIDTPSAREEIQYALPKLTRTRLVNAETAVQKRRKALADMLILRFA